MTTHDAVEFVVGQVVDEASRQGIALADLEREVLSFVESPSMPQRMIEAMETFERDYDDEEYERKIAALLRAAFKRTRRDRKTEWAAAIRRIRDADVFIGVMMDQASLFSTPGDRLRLVAAAVVVVAGATGFVVFAEPVIARYLTPEQQGFYLWLSALAVAGLYTLARWIFGAEAVDDLVESVIALVTFSRKPPRQPE